MVNLVGEGRNGAVFIAGHSVGSANMLLGRFDYLSRKSVAVEPEEYILAHEFIQAATERNRQTSKRSTTTN